MQTIEGTLASSLTPAGSYKNMGRTTPPLISTSEQAAIFPLLQGLPLHLDHRASALGKIRKKCIPRPSAGYKKPCRPIILKS
jgi:hypothetical protein